MIDLDKLTELKHEIESERGEFVFLALLLRDGAPDRWDLVASAPWVRSRFGADLRYITDKVVAHLPKAELIYLSRVVLLNTTDPKLEAVLRSYQVEDDLLEVRDAVLFGLSISRGYIFRAKRPEKLAVS
jgi:hypothetical protein